MHALPNVPRRAPLPLAAALLALAMALHAPVLPAQEVETSTRAQRKAAEEFLAAVATGNPNVVAYAYHPAELERLRTRILEMMRDENERGDFTIRARLFGSAMRLADLERMTAQNFYVALARRLTLTGRQYADYRWLGAVRDAGDVVHVIAKGRQPEGRGKTQVVEFVSVLPYGKDWKAAIPSEIEAQIEDLIAGRGRAGAVAPVPEPSPGTAAGATAGTTPGQPANPPAVLEFLESAEKGLVEGNCEQYYKDHMSPNFRRVTSKKALESLIASCQRSEAMRERLIAALRAVKTLPPRYEYEGARAVYDLSNQGLPFDRFALERIERRWYIAE